MFENDAQPSRNDPVGEALRGLASAVAGEVGPDARLGARAARDRRRRRSRIPALSIAAAAAIAAAAVVIVLGLSSGAHRSATTPPGPPSSPRFASHLSTVSGVRFVSDNLAQVVARSPRMRVRSSTITAPVDGGNDDAIAFGAGSAWVLEGTKPFGGAKPLGRPNRSDCGALVRVNSSTMAATGTLSLRRCPQALAFGDGSVWVLSMQIGTAGYQLTRVDPAHMTVQASTVIDGGAGGVTPQGDTGAKNLFVATSGPTAAVVVQTKAGASQVVTVDAKTLATVASVMIHWRAARPRRSLPATARPGWARTPAGSIASTRAPATSSAPGSSVPGCTACPHRARRSG